MANPIRLQFENVNFSYGDETILHQVSFAVRQNEHLVLKASSGRGKSTILKLILGFLKPQSGTIKFYEGESDRTAGIRSFTGWFPQDLNIGEGTVAEVLTFPFRFVRNRASQPDKAKILDILKRLDLSSGLWSRPWRQLSTGQRARTAIALCFLLDRPLLLLDEPTAALDTAAKQKVADLLLDSGHKTIISTSHDPFWLKRATQIYEIK